MMSDLSVDARELLPETSCKWRSDLPACGGARAYAKFESSGECLCDKKGMRLSRYGVHDHSIRLLPSRETPNAVMLLATVSRKTNRLASLYRHGYLLALPHCRLLSEHHTLVRIAPQ